MSDLYLELHNLEASLTDFAVARIIDDDLQASPECQLPEDLTVALDLPDLDVDLPELVCDYNIDLPLVPLPHFCSPSFSSDVGFEGCDGTTVDVELGFSQDSDCHYTLGGMITVCAGGPCPAGYTGSGTITPVTTTVGPGYVDLFGSFDLALNESCGFVLSGNLELEDNIPDLSHICTTAEYEVNIVDETPAEWTINLPGGALITLFPTITLTKTEATACVTTYTFAISMDSSTTGLSAATVTLCEDGVEVEKQLLVID